MRESIFRAFEKGYVTEIDTTLSMDIGCAIVSRGERIGFDIMQVFPHLAAQISWIERTPDDHAEYEMVFRSLLLNICLIVKFFYPMMEQLEKAIDEKVKVVCEQQN